MTPHNLRVKAILDDIERSIKGHILQDAKIYADILVINTPEMALAVAEAEERLTAEGWLVKCKVKKKHSHIEVWEKS